MAEIDASIPLGVTGGASGMMQPGHPGGNPLALAGVIADVQQKIVGAKQAQAEFMAKRKFGDIMASSPDMDSAVAAAFKDPETAAFAPQLVQSAATTRNAIIQGSGEVGKLGADAFHSFVLGLPAVIKDPSQYPAVKATALALTPGVAKARLAESMDNFERGLNAGLDKDPERAREQKTQRLIGWANASGAGEALKNILEQPGTVDTGPVIQPTLTTPALGGQNGSRPGTVQKVGNALTKGIPPQMANSEAVPFGGGSASNALGLPAPKSSVAPKQEGTAPVPESVSSFDGAPLFDDKTAMSPPSAKVKNLAGNPTGLEGQRAGALMKEFTEQGKSVYDNAVRTKGNLAEMDRDFDVMAKGGGLMVPGAAADFRLSLGKLATTVKGIAGNDGGINDLLAQKVAAAEDLSKATQRMGINYLQTQLGSQREAAETIKNITEKGIPGIGNTYMGGKMLIAMIGALNDRAIDQNKWETEWARRNNGDLREADQKFSQKFPATQYIDKALAKLGMDQSGFTSRAALDKALANKLVTPEQYELIRKNKGKIPDSLPPAQ